jgi:hypothetical protein
MKRILLALIFVSLAFSDLCGGNCPSGNCPTCYCGSTKNMVDILIKVQEMLMQLITIQMVQLTQVYGKLIV